MMRPIEIEINNFGPFKKELIDFRQLKHHTLFLITGKTGAGKTTIFDAMMFALYGTASTQSRNFKALRNQHAQDHEESYIRFLFAIQNKQYEVIRNLPHVKEGKKTPIQSRLEFYECNDKIKEKISTHKKSETNELIKSIVKLNADQFRQILILPQGEFKKFLVSDSESKNDILRTLFNTKYLEEMVKKLKEKVDDKIETKKRYEHSIELMIRQLDIELPNDMIDYGKQIDTLIQYYDAELMLHRNDVERLKDYESKFNKKLEALQSGEKLNEQYKKLEQYRNTYNELKKQKSSIDSKRALIEQLTQLDTYYKIKKDIEELETKIAEINQTIQTEKDNLQKYSVKRQELEEKYEEKLLLDNEMEQLNHYLISNKRFLNVQYKSIADEIKQLELRLTTLDKYKKEKIQLQDQYEMIKDEIKVNEKFYLEQLEQNIKINEVISQEQQKSELLNEYRLQKIKIIELQNQMSALQENYQVIQKELDTFNFGNGEFDKHSIEVIKSQLKEGQNCPVCNNKVLTINDISHDKYHQLVTEQKANESEINNLANKIKWENEQCNKYEEKLASIEFSSVNHMQLKEVEEIIQKTYKTIEENKIIKEKNDRDVKTLKAICNKKQTESEKFEKKIKSISSDIEKLNDDLALLPVIKDKYESFISETTFESYESFEQYYIHNKKEYQKYIDEVNQLKISIDNTSKAITNNNKTIEHQSDMLMINNKLLEERMTTMRNYDIPDDISVQYESENIEGILNDLNDKVKTFDNDYKQFEVLKNEYEMILEGKTRPDIIKLQQDYEKQKAAKNAVFEKVNRDKSHLQIMLKAITQLENEYCEYNNHMRDIVSEMKLYEVLNGKNELKLSIENYVLIYYLEQILKLSNERLKKMSHHRYELVRKIEADARKRSGLEIEVYDFHANRVRDISSLSGGETFIASLCLALGLSDYVMQQSGGINLESVFIDEGFGTLDQETLDTAVDVLIELQQSGKLIGIISHVQSLKETIPAMLKVTSDGFYSNTSFVFK
ncbi:AAA family ATPase [Macrococcus armenti]|uniref:Nuclease SbcCD subunit C n=1 Tax=Macrococcus armenti TaxID=2875764 RepID=A0ABY3ZWZ5_9STAP|nr:AAA family ATPase [Macrococcus armenti]UOB19538.1 AAA family ATPase [Macrococcus armenti]